MTTINEYLQQSQLALAAYANLFAGMNDADYIKGLEKVGMPLTEAENFVSNWRVIDQDNDPTGLSATVFENVADGKRYLAIRGTELTDPSDIATDLIDIGMLGTAEYQAQYAALSVQGQKWLNEVCNLVVEKQQNLNCSGGRENGGRNKMAMVGVQDRDNFVFGVFGTLVGSTNLQ